MHIARFLLQHRKTLSPESSRVILYESSAIVLISTAQELVSMIRDSKSFEEGCKQMKE